MGIGLMSSDKFEKARDEANPYRKGATDFEYNIFECGVDWSRDWHQQRIEELEKEDNESESDEMHSIKYAVVQSLRSKCKQQAVDIVELEIDYSKCIMDRSQQVSKIETLNRDLAEARSGDCDTSLAKHLRRENRQQGQRIAELTDALKDIAEAYAPGTIAGLNANAALEKGKQDE